MTQSQSSPVVRTKTSDRWHMVALIAANAAQVVVPLLRPTLNQKKIGDVSDEFPSPITPPDVAFAVWGPIFSATSVSSILQALPGRQLDSSGRQAVRWLVGSYFANAAWAWTVQQNRWLATPPIISAVVGCSAIAHTRLQKSSAVSTTPWLTASTGMLLGWTSIATLVNYSSVATARGNDPDSPRSVAISSASLILAGASLATLVSRSNRGGYTAASTSGWALLTLAATRRPSQVRVAAATSLVALGAGVATRLKKTHHDYN